MSARAARLWAAAAELPDDDLNDPMDTRDLEKPTGKCPNCSLLWCACAANRTRLLTSPFGLDADELADHAAEGETGEAA